MEYMGLVEQFKSANGILCIDLHSKEFLLEFSEWLKNMKFAGKDYISFLESLDIDFNNNHTSETGKIFYDSLAIPYETRIITPEIQGFNIEDKTRIVQAKLKVINGNAFLESKNKMMHDIPIDFINTYMTHNPYNNSCINGWHLLHNSGDYNIIVGVFGNIWDKDIDKKIRTISDLKDKLDISCIEQYTTIDDTYHYVIGTHQKTKKLYKSR